jgi:hypothetical protein
VEEIKIKDGIGIFSRFPDAPVRYLKPCSVIVTNLYLTKSDFAPNFGQNGFATSTPGQAQLSGTGIPGVLPQLSLRVLPAPRQPAAVLPDRDFALLCPEQVAEIRPRS